MKKEEIKEKFLVAYCGVGDLYAYNILEEFYKECDVELEKEIEEILPILYNLNYSYIEYIHGTNNKEIYNILDKYNIEDFYIEIKGILFNILEISDSDIEKY